MTYDEALKAAKAQYGESVIVFRKPRNGFAAHAKATIRNFLGEIDPGLGQAQIWWVYRVDL